MSERVPRRYEIRVREGLDESWAAWFPGFRMDRDEEGHSVLSGEVPDSSALYGIVAKLRDLNLTLVSITEPGLATERGT
jgi:hypothetical protein